MGESITVMCPYCLEWVELWVDVDTTGQYTEDCAVCCRPWHVHVERDEHGGAQVQVTRDD